MLRNEIKVLLVEDNPGDVRLVRELLFDVDVVGLNLTHADTLGAALNLIKHGHFDVMLLDLSLPDAQGLETVNAVLNVKPSLPIVILSGNQDSEMALQAVHLGAQDYLVKGQGDGNLLARSLHYAIERKAAEERLAYMAQYDQLTDLPNRSLFNDRLSNALHHARRHERQMVLMFLDLDHFKDINDSLGHNAGDELLKNVAERLRNCVREDDTIARLGGDEFTIILNELHQPQEAGRVAEKILDALTMPFLLNDQEVFVTTSIGIADYPASGTDSDTLIRNADTALYRAKSEGRSNYKYFESEMNLAVSERMTLINDLRHAVQRDEFELFYQPLIQARTGDVFGMEALLRWNHPERGLIPSSEFVPLLEETGLIIPVGEWVVRQACLQNKLWQKAGLPPLCVSVNLSVRQFHKQDLATMISDNIKATNMDPRLLQLEITESVLMDRNSGAASTLDRLRKLGVRLAIDDFGTGYSSLSYLKQYSFDTLKFDRAFIKDMATSENGAAIVASVINLGHSLGMTVVAEGVESQHQLTLLHDRQCDQFQGYLFARPMEMGASLQWLQDNTAKSYSSLQIRA